MAAQDKFNVKALADEVLRNPNPGTRKIALQGLSIYLKYERIAELVRYVSQRDNNAEVRETAAKILESSSTKMPVSDIQQ